MYDTERQNDRLTPVERREQQSEALWRMSPDEREQAMWGGDLSLRQLREWSSRRPEEVPKIGGEFAWIAITTPELADAESSASSAPRGRP